ncbi:MAG: LysR substrate-binding domain-containing protein [Pseudomonadota bacterium]|jgi:LysR family tcuABC transcriptional regulator|nr:LysR substrate-binding domain-containing protein [Pseudomonadota bacterium]
MELRQLRFFVTVAEFGSMNRAAVELGVVPSALSQAISRLEGELATRLLQRSPRGVIPTDAGLAFLQQAQLVLRHAEDAARAARQRRLSGRVSIGLAPSTASIIGMPLVDEMRQRYPDVRIHLVESLSGQLATMLNARQLDLAILFETGNPQRLSLIPLLDERLELIGRADLPGMPTASRVRLASLRELPLILPSGPHGLRQVIESAFARARVEPRVAVEVDGLALLMDAVAAGIGATIQPAAALRRIPAAGLRRVALADRNARRRNLLASLSDDELSPAALAARVVITGLARRLVDEGQWLGASIHGS